jgi:1,5-anhydro-D-fructose reductase (1,5-anhydro-D-mannitol-forming)
MQRKTTEGKLISRRDALATLVMTTPLLFGLSASETASQLRTGARGVGRIRIAMLSFWHVHASDYARQALENNATAIAAIWDEMPERGHAQAKAFGVPFYERLDDLLAHADVDGVIVDTPTTMHRDVMVACARAGKHIFTEKVLAPTLRECNEIVAAVRAAGVTLMVSLPRLYSGSTLAIKAILDRKLLGELTLVRTRLTHDGALGSKQNPQVGWLPPSFFNPQLTAGGVMIDLGAHPMYLTRLFLGLPTSVSASFGTVTGHAVEDNVVTVLRYPHGALGIVEASFVNHFSPFTIEVHGTDGSLLYGTPDATVRIRSSLAGRPANNAWSVWADIPPDQSPPFQQWVSHMQHGTTAAENVQAAIDLSMLIEAANSSAKKDQPVRLDSLVP